MVTSRTGHGGALAKGLGLFAADRLEIRSKLSEEAQLIPHRSSVDDLSARNPSESPSGHGSLFARTPECRESPRVPPLRRVRRDDVVGIGSQVIDLD